jgi:hypothetical protein
LADNYISAVHGRPGGRGGGLYELTIHFLTNTALPFVVASILSGIAWDLIKSGTNSFVLRPFLDALKKLVAKNKRIGIDVIRIDFSDSVLIIDWIEGVNVDENLKKIFLCLAKHFHNLILSSGEAPYEIYIPVFEDPSGDIVFKFRALLSVDETIPKVDPSSYFGYWGILYNISGNARRVYDVKRGLLYDEDFCTEEQYWRWKELQRRAEEMHLSSKGVNDH